MEFFKKLFGKTETRKEEPVRRISVAPGQSQEEQDSTRSRMEAEMSSGRAKRDAETAHAVTCPHTALVPRWDKAGDMGHEDRATSFMCDTCEQSFTPEEAHALRTTESDRLNEELDLDAAREA